MSKIKFKLVKFEKALVLQTESIADDLKGKLDYTARNSVVLRSNKTTDLNEGEFAGGTNCRIYFGGTVNSKASKVAVRHFLSNDARDAYYDDVMNALTEWKDAGYPVSNRPSQASMECPCETGSMEF